MNHIRLRKNDLCVENISALRLAKKYKTPFYCYSLKQLKENYTFFKNTFRKIKHCMPPIQKHSAESYDLGDNTKIVEFLIRLKKF